MSNPVAQGQKNRKGRFGVSMKVFVALSLGLLGIYLFELWSDRAKLNYRLIATVEIDGKLVEGSSVAQAKLWRIWLNPLGLIIMGGRPTSTEGKFTAEAVVVDLGERGLLFVTLAVKGGEGGGRWSSYPPLLYRAFVPPDRKARIDAKYREGERTDIDKLAEIARLPPGTSADIRPEIYPEMVRFRDLDDPASVEHVDPDDLAASFGPGARFVKLRVETTHDEPVSTITQRLKWLDDNKYSKGGLDGQADRMPRTYASKFGRLAFKNPIKF